MQKCNVLYKFIITNAKHIFPFLFNLLNNYISDMFRAQTYGMMVVSKDQEEVECEFRHLSLAEYLSAIHIHTTGTESPKRIYIFQCHACINFLNPYIAV